MGIETFKSRARVIDLLGRQQIADAPTATGELFKNALDAGASHVQVNYVDPQNSQGIGFLRISDNGLGMRLQEDVVGKWLVLGSLFRALLFGFSVTLDPLCEIKKQRGRPVELYVHFSTIYSTFSA